MGMPESNEQSSMHDVQETNYGRTGRNKGAREIINNFSRRKGQGHGGESRGERMMEMQLRTDGEIVS